MSAFFEWNTGPVKVAILAELARQGRSIDPDDYEEGADDWGETCVISLPDYARKEFFTEEWDVNVWDNAGIFTVTAYPMYRGEGDYSSWITLLEKEMLATDESRSYGPHHRRVEQ